MFRDFYSKLYRIYLTVSKLYKANHFKPLNQLKLLGEFAKIWFGKNFPVAVTDRDRQARTHACTYLTDRLTDIGTLAHRQTDRHARTYACPHTGQTDRQLTSHTYMQACTPAHTDVCTHAHTRDRQTANQTYMHACMHPRTHSHTYARTHERM